MTETLHNLKIEKQYFEAVDSGVKNFEIRNNDRNFNVGDLVLLSEIDDNKNFTGRKILVRITYITDYMQHYAYVVFGFEKL